MTRICEGNLKFSFSAACAATKYDEWEFYRRRFQSANGGKNAVDMICLADDAVWLIEVKDYRLHDRTKPTDHVDEVAQKVRDTLAGLEAACDNAADSKERDFARQALSKRKRMVVLHLEQPDMPRQLPGPTIEPADAAQRLGRLLKDIDSHPKVLDRNSCASVPWIVDERRPGI